MTDVPITDVPVTDVPVTDVVVQRACEDDAPSDEAMLGWAQAVLARFEEQGKTTGEVTLRLVSAEEMQTLNHTYRDKNTLTNVLSFPVEEDIRTLHGLLGDVVICPVVVDAEAKQQNKERDAHYAHLVIHGVLHLLGFDHIEDGDATEMEALETSTLETLGISDPYVERVA